MPTLDVTKSFGATLRVNCEGRSVGFRVVYDSGRNFPFGSLWVTAREWDRLVAWVELQRKEEALKEAK
ncbi:MAG: hypothetical protein ISS58_00570 [Dehalococcoidales bacterium]|nr:hypothetical protein [Dehalococcoidales bacterium]